MNSARGNDYDFTQTLTLDDETNKVVNLESTAELKAFATVDLDKINMERTNQLKLALEDNLREKENELKSIENSYY